eukprot:1850598-Pleurochrysis_carterae.AAC.1
MHAHATRSLPLTLASPLTITLTSPPSLQVRQFSRARAHTMAYGHAPHKFVRACVSKSVNACSCKSPRDFNANEGIRRAGQCRRHSHALTAACLLRQRRMRPRLRFRVLPESCVSANDYFN